jgi:serine/threonine protein kinase
VYRARDTRTGRTVALKFVHADVSRDPLRRERLLGDARAAATLSHPNIAALFEVGEADELLFLASEYVSGDSLRTLMAGRPIHPRRALELAAQVADALAEAHALGLFHGDLTVDTIVVSAKGSAKIMEPGFAAWIGRATPGTGSNADGDLSSLGAVLCEMLTGTAPAGSGAVTTPSAQALPDEIDRVIRRMLSADPDDRFASAAVVAGELRSLAGAMVARGSAAESPALPGAREGRSRTAWLIAALVLCSAIALVWLAVRGG